jgi:uncharacterized membrane protein
LFVGSTTDISIQTITENIARLILNSEAKLRWEEGDEMEYVKDAIMELQTLFNGIAISIAQCSQLSENVSHTHYQYIIVYYFYYYIIYVIG